MSNLSYIMVGAAFFVTGLWLVLLRELRPTERLRLQQMLDKLEKGRKGSVLLSGRVLHGAVRLGLTIGVLALIRLAVIGTILEPPGDIIAGVASPERLKEWEAYQERISSFVTLSIYAILSVAVLPFLAASLVALTHAFVRWPLRFLPNSMQLIEHYSLMFWILGLVFAAIGGIIVGNGLR